MAKGCHINPREKYLIVERTPTVAEYTALRKALGYPRVSPESALKGLGNSDYCVCVLFEKSVIGMGRVIGDGALYYFIQDVMVSPEFAGQGIETCIMDNIMLWLKEHTPDDAFFCVREPGSQAPACKQFGFGKIPE